MSVNASYLNKNPIYVKKPSLFHCVVYENSEHFIGSSDDDPFQMFNFST